METPTAPAQANIDDEHLRLLTIFHYVLGGVYALFSCFFLIHFVLGLFIALSPGSFATPSPTMPTIPGTSPVPATNPNAAPPAFIGYFFMLIGGTAIAAGWTLAALTAYAGRCIQERKRYMLVMVVAGINCLWVPFGTALGVCSIIVLNRPTVRPLFDTQSG
jgi:hypothetical protein